MNMRDTGVSDAVPTIAFTGTHQMWSPFLPEAFGPVGCCCPPDQPKVESTAPEVPPDATLLPGDADDAPDGDFSDDAAPDAVMVADGPDTDMVRDAADAGGPVAAILRALGGAETVGDATGRVATFLAPGGAEVAIAPDTGAPIPAQTSAEPEVVQTDPPIFTMDQIADQLTDGYWLATGGAAHRAFDVGPGDTLYVDISALGTNGQALARQALDAWTAVTGILFVEAESLPEPTIWENEVIDAASGTTTTYAMPVGQGFRGTLSTGADRDAVAVNLMQGQTYTIALGGDASGGNPTIDPYLRVLNATGTQIAENDDADDRDSRLTFTASYTGLHYLQAGSYGNSYAGDYTLRIAESATPTHIRFDDAASGAYAQSQVLGTTILSSFVNVNWNWTGGENRIDGYHYQTYLHEIGHALGLGHAGNYNGSALFGRDNHYANDSWAVSLMSYFHQTENPYTQSSFAYAITPMMADILAIQTLYGASEHAAGDTVYGRGGTSGTYLDDALDLSAPTAWTVYDTGGTDHFDFSGFTQDQRLDLRDEHWSDLAGLIENIAIMRGTIIENGTTGAGDDQLTGNAADNALWAGAGDDTIDAGAGHDAAFGDDGADRLSGEGGQDLLDGGAGADLIEGGDGGDLLVGDMVSLADLIALYPTWEPPADAEARLDAGDLHILWDDILLDVFDVA